jgi:hypothetical protein
VDHAAAETRAAELKVTHPDRLTHTWMARGNPDGEWEVVKVRLPGFEARPKGPRAPEPRPSNLHDVPPFGAA